LNEITELAKKRKHLRLWVPGFKDIFARMRFFSNDSAVQDEDPDSIPGLESDRYEAKRDPDVYPPRHLGHVIGLRLSKVFDIAKRPDVIFGIKAGIVSCASLFLHYNAMFAVL
jgi:hypothetical protein